MATTSINQVLVINQPGVVNVAVDFTTTRALRVYDVNGHLTAADGANPTEFSVSSTAAAILTVRAPGAGALLDVLRPLAGTNDFTVANQTIAAGGIVRCIGDDGADNTATINIFCIPG